MYSTSDTYKQAIEEASNLQWEYSIKKGNEVIDSSAGDRLLQSYQQSCYYMNSLSVGNVVSQYVNMTLRGIGLGLTDSFIQPVFYLGEQSVPSGVFNVLSAKEENGYTNVVAYDNVKKLDQAYSTELTYPASISDVITEVGTLCGVTFDTTGIAYPSISIPKAYTLEKCSQVMQEICKLLGKNLVADRSGNLVFKWFASSVTVPIDNHFSQRLDESDYTIGQMSCTTSNGILTSGTTGGIMMFNSDYMTQEQLDAIKTANTMTYRGADLIISGDPSIDVWDVITVTDLNENRYSVPVMNNILEFDGAMKNTITSFAKSESEQMYGTDDNGTKKIMEIQKSIDGIRVHLQEDYTDNTQLQTIIQTTAGQVSSEVSKSVVSEAVSKMKTYILSVSATNGTVYDDEHMDNTLVANVTNMGDVVALPSMAYSWSRKSVDDESDRIWNSVGRYGSTLSLTADDINDNCTFMCDVCINDAVDLTDTNDNVITDTDGNTITTLVPRLVLHAEISLQSTFRNVKSLILQLTDKILLQINENGKVAAINLETGETTSITLSADDINLEGLVTANGKFKILADGTPQMDGGAAINTVLKFIDDNGSVYGSINLIPQINSSNTKGIITIDGYEYGMRLSTSGTLFITDDSGNDIVSCQCENVEDGVCLFVFHYDVSVDGTLYLNSSPSIKSDASLKKEPRDFDERFYKLAEKIYFKQFKYIDGTSDRYHNGAYVQEILALLEEFDIDLQEFAVICLDKNGIGSIRYEELNVLMNWYTRERMNRQDKTIAEQKKELAEHETEIEALKELVIAQGQRLLTLEERLGD